VFSDLNEQNVFGRFLFSTLVTYLATQAHGWAGGVATPYWFTITTWALVTFVSIRVKSRAVLLGISLGVQLAIHYGTMSSHAHAMNTSEEAMILGHVLAGFAAWAITVFSEGRFTSFNVALSLFKFGKSPSIKDQPILWTLQRLFTQETNFRFSSRAPPVPSNN
jgi:hypothetical protein